MSRYENTGSGRESKSDYENRRQAAAQRNYEVRSAEQQRGAQQQAGQRYAARPQQGSSQAGQRYAAPPQSNAPRDSRRSPQQVPPQGGTPPKKKGGVGSVLTTLLLIVAIAVFCFAAYKLIGFYLNYKEGADEYAKLNKDFVTIDTVDAPEESGRSDAGANVLQKVEELEDPDTRQAKVDAAATDTAMENGTEKKLPLMVNPIDFAELQGINDEIIGWLRLGALDISYPIAQAKDNDYYLHRTFERTDNFAGCIFLNCDNSRYFTDQNSIVYGHNMKNGSMFGRLKDLRDQATYDSNPYFWIFTPELIYQYRIFSCSVVSSVGDPYRTRFTTDEFQYFIDAMATGSLVDNHGVKVTTDDRIVTLSTCTGNNETRFITQGVLEQIYISK